MAIYHFHLSVVQRSKGQGVVQVAADRSRTRLHDERLGRTFRPWTNKSQVPPILSEVLLPEGAPERWRERSVLWNEVEAREARGDAGLAREAEFALPMELTPDEAAGLARGYVVAAFVADGMVADLNVHWAVRDGDRPKPYAQVLLAMRRCGPDGFGLKERTWNDWTNALRWRRLWAEMANACLAEHGHLARVDHRSHAKRGIALEPQNKIGPNAARRARRGEGSERVDEHAGILRRNAGRDPPADGETVPLRAAYDEAVR